MKQKITASIGKDLSGDINYVQTRPMQNQFLHRDPVLLLSAGVGNCFGLRAASRSRKLAEGRTFKRTHWYIILIDLHFRFGITLKTNNY